MYNVISVGIMLFISASLSAENESYDYETVLQGIEYGEELIQDGMGSMTWSFVVNDSTDSNTLETIRDYFKLDQIEDVAINEKSSIFFAFKGDKARLEDNFISTIPEHRGGNIYERIGISLFDGEKNYSYMRHRNYPQGTKTPFKAYGTMSVKSFLNGNKTNPLEYIYSYNSLPFSDFFDNKVVNGMTFVNEDYINDYQCQVYKYQTQNSDSTYTFYLVPAVLYKPTRIIIDTHDYRQVVNITYSEIAQGIWFLKKRSRVLYHKEESNVRALFEETVGVSNDFKVNIDVPDDLFVIHFPDGLGIVEEESGEVYYTDKFSELYSDIND